MESESGKIYKYRTVPCGKCFQCVAQRTKGWTFRLTQQAKDCTSCSFITLTYDEENLPYSENGIPTLEKKHLQLFFKRLRKATKTEGIKYYACGEYGKETHRPHYHAIMFNLPLEYTKQEYDDSKTSPIGKTWGKGNVLSAPGNNNTFAYVAGYVNKKIHKPTTIYDDTTGEIFEREQEFSLMSKKLGINFCTPEMKKYLKNNLEGYVTINGYMQSLPRYLKEKIFTAEERRLISIKAEQYREDNLDLLDKESIRLHYARIEQGIEHHIKTLDTNRTKI